MKALKITLVLVFLVALFTSCTKQDLNQNDILQKNQSVTSLDTGGNGDK